MFTLRLNLAALSLSGILTLGVVAAAQEAAPVPAAVSKEIETLIAQLSSPDEKAREAAQEKLLNMGEAAATALEAHVRARTAAEATLQKIDANKAASPTLLTLDLKDATAEAALAEIAKQTGYELTPQNPQMWPQAGVSTVTFKADKQPFWTVLREVCSQAKLTIINMGYGNSDRKLQFAPAQQYGPPLMKHPAVVSGAFMIVVSSLQRTHAVDLANLPNVNRSLNMQLQVFVEPKVKVIQSSYTAEIEEALDDKGLSLLGDSPDRFGRNMNGNRGTSFNANVPLQYPNGAGDKIAKLRGKLRILAQTRSELLEIGDLMNAKETTKTIAGRRITFKGAKKISPNQYEVSVSIYRDGLDQRQFQETANSISARLVDGQGREYFYNGPNGGGGGDQLEYRLMFSSRPFSIDGRPTAAPGEPVKFLWDIPTASKEILIPFELSDLPLP